jgi:dienelactone hydrolase
MGCVVFQYDMVGRGDSRALKHGDGFNDADALLRLQSAMGMQTWNSIRSLDFLAQLPDVDDARIGVTGASGGGTQSIVLAAIDDRPASLFPAVMVSTSMQGGCACENAPLLRIGMGNVDLAACFAPKPLGMTNANDWTLHFLQKGYPELKALYQLLGRPEAIGLERFPQFKHNFNAPSRAVLYAWMNQHLHLEADGFVEREIDVVPPAELSVFDELHKPAWGEITSLRAEMTKQSTQAMSAIEPVDLISANAWQNQIRAALEVMVASRLPQADEVDVKMLGSVMGSGYRFDRLILARHVDPAFFAKEAVPSALFIPDHWDARRLLIWVDPQGHAPLLDATRSAPGEELARLLQNGFAVLVPHVLLTGEHHRGDRPAELLKVSMEDPKFTLTYQRSLFAQRVHDVLTAIGFARSTYPQARIDLMGVGAAGPWVLLASGVSRPTVRRTVVDVGGFRFEDIREVNDEGMLPGAVKYGGILGLARLVAPSELEIFSASHETNTVISLLQNMYMYFGVSESLKIQESSPNQVRDALNRLIH